MTRRTRGSGLRLAVLCSILPVLLRAQSAASQSVSDTTPKVTFGGFVDGYYAYDFNRPVNFDRAFTTQPARHNEFNINLAFVEAKLDAPGVRGRLALQAGTSVQSNYAGEPRTGSISGPGLARSIQEAVVGVKVGNNLWVDGGIFLSHIGMEGFISRDNPMYTRSLVADYSPYYESGAKLTWQPIPTLTTQLDVVNGWQIISESNSAKSAGVRIDYAPSSTTVYSYYNYVGDEAPDTAQNRQRRLYNGIGVKSNITARCLILAEADYGAQQHSTGAGSSRWYGGMLTGRYQITAATAIVGRAERFADDDQVILLTSLPDGFRATGASIGLDVTLPSRALWRTELRGFRSAKPVFPRRTGGASSGDAFVVSSLGLTF